MAHDPPFFNNPTTGRDFQLGWVRPSQGWDKPTPNWDEVGYPGRGVGWVEVNQWPDFCGFGNWVS